MEYPLIEVGLGDIALDKTHCGFCGRPVSPEEWELGLAVILLSRVWCQDCQVKMIAQENKKRAAKGKKGRYSGHRITTVRPPDSEPTS